jgi:predicted ATPase
MFRSLSVHGFRGFDHLKIEGLERINLLLGRNNVGKTAVLEALFLLAGPTNPNLSVTLNSFRGIERFTVDPEEIWGWLFHSKDLSRDVVIESKDSRQETRRLQISLCEGGEISFGNRSGNGSDAETLHPTDTTPVARELHFRHKIGNQEEVTTKAFVSEKGIGVERGPKQFPTSVFVTARSVNISEDPLWFSQLEEVGQEVELLPPLQLLEPRLRRLSVLVVGERPMIHGDLGLGRMVPIPMMGDGVGRLLKLLLAIGRSKHGVVMIDEIDTGFHYSVLKDVWTAVAEFARQSDAQIFATTHSWECLRAAHESFADSTNYDFSLFRLDRTNGQIAATRFDDATIEAALAGGLEVR